MHSSAATSGMLVKSAGSAASTALIARRFQALSDPTRLAILESLRDGECCVCDLQSSLEAAQSRLSFHLRVLKEAGLVTDRKDGRWSWYQLVPGAVESLHLALDRLSAARGFGLPVRASNTRAASSALPVLPLNPVQADGCCG